jgi:hypothetical protein
MKRSNSQNLDPEYGPHNVDNGVRGPDLMKVDLFRRAIMDFAFDASDGFEDFDALGLDPIAEIGFPDDLPDFHDAPVYMFGRGSVNEKPGPMEVVSPFSTHLQIIPLDRKLAECGPEQIKWKPRIDQSTHKHVPADAGKTVQVGDFHIPNVPFPSLALTSTNGAIGCQCPRPKIRR